MSYVRTEVIEVRAWGATVGAVTLDPASGYYAFEYDPAWTRRGIELAPLHMPVGPGVFVFPQLPELTYRRLPAMLADSLPDRFGNALVDARLAEEGVATGAITPLDRLAYAGDRAMGALEYHPPVAAGPDHTTAVQLADLVVAARFALRGEFTADETTQEALTQLIQVGTSAGGARAKAVISFNPDTGQVRSGQLEAPAGFEHWLLKLDGVDGDRLTETQSYGRIEYAYALMAAEAGVTMAPCRLLEENGRAHFMTRRFDRLSDGGKVHVQTLCALAHLDFNQADTHSYSQYLDVVDRLGLGRDALAQAFRRVVFNVAAANRDDHTKNLAFCCDEDGVWSLAPAYDVNHAHNPVGEWTQRHQMGVNGRFEHITAADLLAVADLFAVPSAKRIVAEVAATVADWPRFAATAEVPEERVATVAADLRRFRVG